MRDPKLVEIQQDIEALFDKNQALPEIKAYFAEYKDGALLTILHDHGVNEKLALNLMAQIALHKRCSASTMFGILRHREKTMDALKEQIELCIELGLVTWDDMADSGQGQFIVRHEIPDELQTRLDKFQFPLPMIVEPRHLFENGDSGYFTGSTGSVLNDLVDDRDICLDHLNRMSSIRLAINFRIANGIGPTRDKVLKPNEGESAAKHKSRIRAFDKFDSTSRWIMDCLGKISDVIYLTYKYDRRGRSYAQGYHISPQGAPWHKSVLEFADKEFIQ